MAYLYGLRIVFYDGLVRPAQRVHNRLRVTRHDAQVRAVVLRAAVVVHERVTHVVVAALLDLTTTLWSLRHRQLLAAAPRVLRQARLRAVPRDRLRVARLRRCVVRLLRLLCHASALL